MRVLMVLCFVSYVAAGALPHGYNYQSPQFAAGSSGGYAYSPPQNAASGTQYSAGGGYNYGAASNRVESTLGGGFGSGSIGGLGHSGIGHTGGLGGHSGHAGGTITKNFFIHSAPEDSDDDLLRDSQNAGPSNKKYNIVFVKSPGQSAKAAALALRKAQSEENTLIYVLNKKLDASDFQAALQANPTQPTKPEVVFIKYKTPEEAQHAQHQIQQQYEALGGGPSHVSDEGYAPVSSVIGALGSAPGHVHTPHNQYLPQSF